MNIPHNSDPIVAACRASCLLKYGVQTIHVCDVGKCNYWKHPQRHVFVCIKSLHFHVCSKTCSLAEEQGGSWVCPVSGIETSCSELVYYPARQNVRGVDRFVNTISWKGTSSKSKLPKRTRSSVKSLSGLAVQTMIVKILNQTSTYATKIKKVAQSNVIKKDFQEVFGHLLGVFNQETIFLELPPTSLCTRIADYINQIYTTMDCKPSHFSIVAVVFSLLAVGMTVRGVTVFPVDEWVKARAPKMAAYGNVVGLQCRGMSTVIRSLKRAIAANGVISESLVFHP